MILFHLKEALEEALKDCSEVSVFWHLLRREVSQEMGGGRLAKKSHWEVGGSKILDQDAGGLDFASQLRDVGRFVFKKFSPKQRHRTDTNQAIPCVNKARSDRNFRIQTSIGLAYTLKRMH